jgi:serine/threonine protein phosphatase PrpC
MDASWGQIQGTREYQEDDASVTRWSNGYHLLLLADGIGGHEGGRQASRIVTTSMRDAFMSGRAASADDQVLLKALQRANIALYDYAQSQPHLAGMGATIIAAAFDGEVLDWLSVGDSALLLYRQGHMSRLNARHSMTEVLAMQVARGEITEEVAQKSPERGQLLAAVTGDDISIVDGLDAPVGVQEGDIFILASDGLDVLGQDSLAAVIAHNQAAGSSMLVNALLTAVLDENRPGQDNTTIVVACIRSAA